SRGWQRFALALNVIGAGILFFSFQATSSDFRLVTARTKSVLSAEPLVQYALCVNKNTILQTDSKGNMAFGGTRGCSVWEHYKPAAVVYFEHPSFVTVGFILLMAGFLYQLLALLSSIMYD